MSWRIAYWRGSARLRVTTVEDATQDEVASLLRNLAAKQLDHEYLRAFDPKIDGSRVAVMGFSRGGNAAPYSGMVRFQKSSGPTKGRIVAHLPIYPACNFELVDELNIGSAPAWEFHGADDDWMPATPCRSYIDRLAGAGHAAKMTEYPGALHAFYNPYSPERFSNPKWQTSRGCLRKRSDGKPFTYADGGPDHVLRLH